MPHFAHGQAVAHGHGAGADEAFPAGLEQRALDRTTGGIGAVEHPHFLARRRRGFEQVEQGRDEGVDAAAQVLQVEQEDVGTVHHLDRGPAHLAVEAEDGYSEPRIVLIGGLDHIVLLVALEAMLRPHCGGNV